VINVIYDMYVTVHPILYASPIRSVYVVSVDLDLDVILVSLYVIPDHVTMMVNLCPLMSIIHPKI
jgi:hypothetical protein